MEGRVLGAFEGQSIKPLGYSIVKARQEDQLTKSNFLRMYVSSKGVKILVRDGQVQLDILDIHAGLFQSGLGCCTTIKAELKLQMENFQKFIPRKLPFVFKQNVGLELDRLTNEGVLEKSVLLNGHHQL